MEKPAKIRWAMFPAAYYAANAVYQGYMSLFYTRIGFSGVQIGIAGFAAAVTAVAAQPLWGIVGDRSKNRPRLLAILCACAAAALLPMLSVRGFAAHLMIEVLFYAFFCCLLPMGDSILLKELERSGRPYGPYRLAGGVSFALASAAFGWLLPKTGAGSVVPAVSLLLLSAAAASLALPVPEVKKKEKHRFSELFHDKGLMLLLAFVLPVQITMGFFNTFYAPHFSELRGATDFLLGLGYALSTASEIPYLLLSDRIYAKFGAAKPMCVSAMILALRWLILSVSKSVVPALLSQLLHGGGFIVIAVSMAKYIADHVQTELQASGQMLLNMASFGAARAIGNLCGGMLSRAFGRSGVFMINSAVCALTLMLFIPRVFNRNNATG